MLPTSSVLAPAPRRAQSLAHRAGRRPALGQPVARSEARTTADPRRAPHGAPPIATASDDAAPTASQDPPLAPRATDTHAAESRPIAPPRASHCHHSPAAQPINSQARAQPVPAANSP